MIEMGTPGVHGEGQIRGICGMICHMLFITRREFFERRVASGGEGEEMQGPLRS
jgi:hypothetical protein